MSTIYRSLTGLLLLTISTSALAQSSMAEFSAELLATIVYSAVGILMGIIGFKVVDWLTPGSLAEEVAHKENRALAILAGSMMLGVCIIIASVLVS
jgi:uncharacterized membrane protein YjfL (UPF0719 family)